MKRAATGRTSQAKKLSQHSVAVPKTRCKTVMFYNFKGGSTKSTTCCHQACMLAQRGHTVVLIDADMQCNLTEFFCQLPPELATPESTAEDQAEPSDEEGQVAAALLDLNLASLHPPLPVLKKDAPAPNPAPMDISAVFECDTWVANHPTLLNCLLNYISGHPSLEMPQLKPLTQDDDPRYTGKMWLLPGSNTMNSYNAELQHSWMANGQYQTTAPLLFAGFGKLMHGLAEKYDADFVFVDAGPSNDDLNRVIGTSCDYVQPTIIPDYFNWVSVKGLLTSVLPEWMEWQRSFVAAMENNNKYTPFHRDNGFVYKTQLPFVLPVLATNYSAKVLANGRNRVCWSQWNFIQAMENTVNSPHVMVDGFSQQICMDRHNKHVVPLLKALTYMATAQELGRPIFDLDEAALRNWWGLKSDEEFNDDQRVEWDLIEKEVRYGRSKFESLAEVYEFLLTQA